MVLGDKRISADQSGIMPGRLFLHQDMAECAAFFRAVVPDFIEPPRANIAPGQEIVTCMPDLTLRKMRWGMIPVGRVNARGRPVMETIVNARSETVFDKSAFEGVGRCLVPVSGWYEWTGERRKKTPWRITPVGGGLMAFAAVYDIWKAPGGTEVYQIATVTCPPSGDVKDIHDRMGVIVSPGSFVDWLCGETGVAADLMVPLADGSLKVEIAEGVDRSGP